MDTANQKGLTLSAVERLTGVTRLTLRKRCQNGLISSFNQGNRILIPVDELTRLFPDVSGQAIEEELASNRKTQRNAQSRLTPLPVIHDDSAEIAVLNGVIDNQKEMINLLKARCDELVNDKALLGRQIEQLMRQLEMREESFKIFTRLLPQHTATPSKTSNSEQAGELPKRDAHGRFIKKTDK